MRLATVRRTSFLLRSISTFEIESILAPRKYGVTWARASAESRPETKSAEQRILAVPATRQLSGSLGGKPGCARAATGAASAIARVAFAARNLTLKESPGSRYLSASVASPARTRAGSSGVRDTASGALRAGRLAGVVVAGTPTGADGGSLARRKNDVSMSIGIGKIVVELFSA